jgi:hypothetical protein
LIDLWLLFSLILPFIIFIIHMAWEIEKAKLERKRTSKKSIEPSWIATKAKKNNSKFAVQTLVPIVTFFFIVAYWIYAFQIYYQNKS